jgi:hypothetical protein
MPTQNSLSFHTDRRLRPALRQRPAELADGNAVPWPTGLGGRSRPPCARPSRPRRGRTKDRRPAQKHQGRTGRERASLDQPAGLNHP